MSSRVRASIGGRFHLRAALIATLAFGILLAFASASYAATFDPNLVISNDNMRASDCMSQADIQAFLNTQSGPLKSLVTADYAGKKKPAAQIISEACVKWHISPKVMLTMLQKEQSLLTRTTLVTGSKATLDWALGVGCPDSKPRNPAYSGFGKQVWYGANWLDGYGESWSSHKIALYKDGMSYPPVKPKNIATLKLYIYNPSIGAKSPYGDLSKQSCSGNANFWKIYWKYFGDPFGDPKVKVMYGFQNKSNGGFYYTSSPATRYRYQTSRYWRSTGAAFSWNSMTTGPATQTLNTVSVYRFFDRSKATYLYTSSSKKVARLRSSKYSKRYRFEGEAWRVTPVTTGTTNVYCFLNKKNGTYLYTSSPRVKARYLSAASKKTYRFTGVFHVAE